MTWEAETVDGVTCWRAELVRYGEPLALVVSPRETLLTIRWLARCGRGSTREIAEHGNLLTIEATAELARSCAAGWALGV